MCAETLWVILLNTTLIITHQYNTIMIIVIKFCRNMTLAESSTTICMIVNITNNKLQTTEHTSGLWRECITHLWLFYKNAATYNHFITT